MTFPTRRDALALVLFSLAGCGEPEAALDAGILDAGDAAASDASVVDAGVLDAALADAGLADAGLDDAGLDDAGMDDAGMDDAGMDDAGMDDAGMDDAGMDDAGMDHGDAGPIDAGLVDAGPSDAGRVDPCTPLPAGLTLWTRSDSASTGTPDTYILEVNPGDPFCASITGSGGSWWVNVSNGTTSGVYCSGAPTCSIIVPEGQTALMVTAVTNNIGYYTLTVHYRPR